MVQRYLVTAALPYSNGRLHVGHVAGAYLPADTYVRFLRATGADVRFICGSDDNGVASLISARKQGRPVEELTAQYNALQAADFAGLGIEFDIYGGTHQPEFAELHERLSQAFFRTIHEKGHLVKKTTKQLYDVEAGQFLPDRFVVGTCYHDKQDGTPCGYAEAYGDQCESCGSTIDPLLLGNPRSQITGTAPEPRETTHWYLQLQEFEAPLREWLEAKRGAWRELVLNFSLGQIRKGLPERAMTRDVDWGVPVPLEDPDALGKVIYVWFDAPIGYVSFTAQHCQRVDGDWRAYERWWKSEDCRIVHFIGEDNVVFHALIWPAMLMAEGSYQRPWQVVATAFLNIVFPGRDEEKISKSRGTAIWIGEYLKTFEADPLRYYLTAIAPETRRTAFHVGDFIQRNNSELANTLGNFVNRTMSFAHRYIGGVVPEPGEPSAGDRAHVERLRAAPGAVAEQIEHFHFRDGLAEIMGLARAANKYFEENEPWRTRKTDQARCAATIYHCLQTVRTLATLMAPFLPHTAAKCAAMLRVDPALAWVDANAELAAGSPLGEPEILFRKIDAESVFAA